MIPVAPWSSPVVTLILSPIPNVGKHSEASTIPSLPLVPEPI